MASSTALSGHVGAAGVRLLSDLEALGSSKAFFRGTLVPNQMPRSSANPQPSGPRQRAEGNSLLKLHKVCHQEAQSPIFFGFSRALGITQAPVTQVGDLNKQRFQSLAVVCGS